VIRSYATLARRLLAVWLVLLAASPVTAPFTVCDLSDLGSHPAQVPHSGHALTEGCVKVAPELAATATESMRVFLCAGAGDRAVAKWLQRTPWRPPYFATVLRL
jgi:hypothetical protein